MLLDADGVAARHERQAAGILVLAVVEVLVIDLQEAVELHHRAIGAEAVVLAVAARGADVGGGALEFGALHLAGDGALPDQVVERELIGVERPAQRGRVARDFGRPDGLMGLLRVLGLAGVVARDRGQIGFAEVLENGVAGGGDGFRRHVHAVGSHVGDEAHRLAADVDALIEALRQLHGARRREAQLARGLLLQRRGAEGRVGVALGRLGLEAVDLEGLALYRLFDGAGRGLVSKIQLAQFLSVDGVEAGLEFATLRGGEGAIDASSIPGPGRPRSRVRGRRSGAAPPTGRGRPSAIPAACATARATARSPTR